MTTFDINTIGNRFCIYLRKSREDELAEAITNHDTLALHRTQLMEFAQRLNAPILEVYEEIGSAESISDRTVFAGLLEEVESGNWDGVFVVEIERLSRGNAADQARCGEAFMDSGTYIFTPQKIYDPASESDMEYFEFSLFMSRREYLTIRRRLLNGRLNHCRRGEYIGRLAPYGYEKVKIDGMKTLRINPEQAKYVEFIYEMYADGKSMRDISKRLTEMAVPTFNEDSEQWSANSICNILHNPVYAGKIRWNHRIYKTEKVNGRKRKKVVRNAEPHVFPGLHPAIVSDELFRSVQERLDGNVTPYSQTRVPRNHYAGLIHCGECGAALRFDYRPTRDPYLVHLGWNKGKDCKTKSCHVSSLDTAIIEWMLNEIEDLVIEVQNEDMDKRVSFYNAERERLLAEIAKSKKIINDNIERLEDGIYTKEQFLERQELHNARIEQAKKALATLEAPTEKTDGQRIETLHKTISALQDPDYDVRAKNDLLKSVIADILYTNHSKRGSDSEMRIEVIPV